MATYKRINQLGQAYSVGDNDFLPVDIQGASETQKVKKSDLFYGYVTDAPNDENTKGWTWARRNGNWYRIYPDDYVFEAPTDGKIYVRVNGEWVSVTGVSGDMLQSIYDTHGKATDIFDYVDNAVGVPDNASESLLGAPIVKTGKLIYKDYGIETDVLNCLIYGETIHRLENPILAKSFENKSTLAGIDVINLFAIGRDLLTDRNLVIGSFNNGEDNTVVRTSKPAKVNKGETYTFKDVEKILNLKVVSVNRLNEPDGVFSTTFLPNKSKITIPDNVEYVGVELQFSDKREIDLEEFNNYYLLGTVVYYDNQYNDFYLEVDTPLYSLDSVASDYCDFNKGLIYHNIKKDTLTYNAGWTVSVVGSGFKNSTIPFELSLGQTSWVENSLIYGDSNVLPAKSIDDFAVSDTECIAFHNGKAYIRINYEHLQRNPGQTNQDYENGLEGFLYSNPIDVIYKLDSPIVFDINSPSSRTSGPTTLFTFDSITNFFAVGISFIAEEDVIISQCDLEIKFDNVVNHIVRKRGDEMTGDLLIEPNSTLYVRSIEGYPQDNLDSSLYLNRNSESKIYVNGENPVLDLRDFSTDLDWEPKAKTIQEKEAKDQRIVNAEYVARDYAPIDSPNLVGVPTAPKATQLGTNQIATGEFLKENYFNKTEADENYIHSVDGEASGNLVLNETLPKDVANKKRIPNVEFLENYYYNSDEVNAQFAPIDSPHLTGIPTTPTPDEVTGTQIANVDYVKNNYYKKSGGPIYGDVTVEGTPDKKGDLVVKGNINNAKLDSDGNIINKNLAVVTDNEGNIVTTDVTTSEIQTLKNIKGNIQSQIDNIPKYNYLSGLQTIIPEQEGNIKADLQLYGNNSQISGTTTELVFLPGVDRAVIFERSPANLARPNEYENNGISVIANADGSVTARGTATKDTWPILVRIDIPSSIVSGDITISLSSPASVVMAFQSRTPSGKTENVYLPAGYTSVTTKIKSGYIGMHIFLSLSPGATIDETFYIMIAQGTEAKAFSPYVAPSITQLPIPRELHRIGEAADKCITRVKSVYDKRIVLDGTEDWKMGSAVGDGAPYIVCDLLNDHYQSDPIVSSRIPYTSISASNKNQGIGGWNRSLYLRYDSLFTNVEELKTYLSAHPLTVYYQSTTYNGTNGLDVCMTEYQTGFVELDGETLAFTAMENNTFWNLPFYSAPGIASVPHIISSHFPSNVFQSNVAYSFIFSTKTKMKPYFDTVEALNAYLAAQKAAGTPVQVVYQLTTPEQYATDPIEDIPYSSNTNYMSGGEIEVINYYGVGNGQWPSQSEVDKKVIPLLEKAYPDASTWDAVTVRVTLQPSDKIRDLLYYYTDGTLGSPKGWYYLYDLSTSINRANGTTAGIVEDSTNGDVTFADGSPIVHHSETADKLSTARTINGTSFDGSANITTAKWGTARTLNASGVMTGSTSIDGSNNINLNLTYNYIPLPENSDLNDYKTFGHYYVELVNIARTFINCPTEQAFGLEIISSGAGIAQIITTYSPEKSERYYRVYYDYNSSWSPWYRIYSESDKPTSTEIGALPITGGTVTGTLVLSKSQDADGGLDNKPALIIGGITSEPHIEIDANEIMAKDGATNVAELYINNGGGLVTIGKGGLKVNGPTNINSTLTIQAPTADNHAATKKYVDDAMASAGTGDMLKNVYDTNNNGIVDNAEKVNGLTVQTAVPANAKFTDTTYGVVSTSANGLAPKLPGNTTSYLRGDGTWATISVPSGAVSGVKGNAESTYRSGNVNLTPANIGAMPLGGSITLTSDLTINCATGSISIVDGELNYDAGTY